MYDNSEIALAIEDARRSNTTLRPFTEQDPLLTLDDAYDVMQRASIARSIATGARPVGRKIGFTNARIWDLYGVYAPIWGWMYDNSLVLCEGGTASIDTSALCQPRVEPEIVFRLSADVSSGASTEEVAASVEWVAFGFEVVQCHYPDWRLTAVDAVIDGSLHAASLVGTRVAPWPSMVEDLGGFSLRLLRDGAAIDSGRGSNVLGNPLNAIAHLAATTDVPLHAGEILTTGTVTDAARVVAGETYTVEVDGLPLEPLALRFA